MLKTASKNAYLKTLLVGTTLSAALLMTPSAFAQDDEIIVTATKRETTLQETPVAVSVTSAATIEKARMLDILDLQSVVPSLRVNQLQASQNTNFIIRGFGNGANNAGIEPSVGVFIDGVYRSRSAARIGDLPKLERIEVLRGPQSTLFGKNASAGVVSVVSAAPSFETEGYIEAGYGNYNNIVGKAYFTGPLSENAAFSIGGGINKRDGYVNSQPGVDDSNDRDRLNIRGQLLFEPSDDTSIRIIGDYSKIDEVCCAVTNYQNEGAAAAIAALGGQFADANDPFALQSFQNFTSVNTLDDYGVSLHIDHMFGDVAATSITSYRDNASFYDNDADFSTLLLLDSVISDQNLQTFTQEFRLASTGANQFDWMVGGYYFNEDVSQLGGLEYGRDLRSYLDLLVPPGTLGLIEAANGFAPGTFFNDNVQTRETFTQDNTAWSAFGTVDFHVNDRLTLTGGLNYTEDKKTVTGSTVNNDVFSNINLEGQEGFNSLVLLGQVQNFSALANAFGLGPLPFSPANVGALLALPGGAAAFNNLNNQIIGGVSMLDLSDVNQNPLGGLFALQFQPQFLAFPNNVESGKSNDDKLTWNVRAAYEVNENVNVYGSVSTGFKSTSWNMSRDSRPFIADATALGNAGLLPNNYTPSTLRNFGTRFAGPEEATVYEIGLKARFERGAINVAVFDQSIKGFQSNVFLGTGFSLSNAGKQSTKGAEIDATFTPVDALTFTFAGTFLDPIYDDFPNSSAGDLTGEKPAGIPSTSTSTSVIYNHDFGNDKTGYIRGDWQYESKVQSNEGFTVTTGAEQPFRTVNTFNASAGMDFSEGFSIQVWARNLFNDEYVTTVFPGVAQAGVINGYRNPPRTYGANLRKTF